MWNLVHICNGDMVLKNTLIQSQAVDRPSLSRKAGLTDSVYPLTWVKSHFPAVTNSQKKCDSICIATIIIVYS